MIDIYRSNKIWPLPGEYKVAHVRDGGLVRVSATVSCPECGDIASLMGHEIEEDGIVSPSVVCPNDDCDFHDYIRLVGWEE